MGMAWGIAIVAAVHVQHILEDARVGVAKVLVRLALDDMGLRSVLLASEEGGDIALAKLLRRPVEAVQDKVRPRAQGANS